MSQRDDAIVAWHQVPGLEFEHPREQNSGDQESLIWLGVERDSPGPKGPAPKGLKNSAQGFTLGFLV